MRYDSADLPVARVACAACKDQRRTIRGRPRNPINVFNCVPSKEVRCGDVPCGDPKLKAETSKEPLPIVAAMVAGVAVEAVVAVKPKKSHASINVGWAPAKKVENKMEADTSMEFSWCAHIDY